MEHRNTVKILEKLKQSPNILFDKNKDLSEVLNCNNVKLSSAELKFWKRLTLKLNDKKNDSAGEGRKIRLGAFRWCEKNRDL